MQIWWKPQVFPNSSHLAQTLSPMEMLSGLGCPFYQQNIEQFSLRTWFLLLRWTSSGISTGSSACGVKGFSILAVLGSQYSTTQHSYISSISVFLSTLQYVLFDKNGCGFIVCMCCLALSCRLIGNDLRVFWVTYSSPPPCIVSSCLLTCFTNFTCFNSLKLDFCILGSQDFFSEIGIWFPAIVGKFFPGRKLAHLVNVSFLRDSCVMLIIF